VYFKLGVDSKCHWNHGGHVILETPILVKFYLDFINLLYDVLIIFKNI
jgi:hypothetical protein